MEAVPKGGLERVYFVYSAREEVEVDDIFAPIIVFVVCVAVFVRNSIWREDSSLNGFCWMVDGQWSHCRRCHRRTAAVRMTVVAIRRWLQLWGICLLVVLLFVACDDENVDGSVERTSVIGDLPPQQGKLRKPKLIFNPPLPPLIKA
jgi:hypothetical protein